MHWSVITKFMLSSRFREMCWIRAKWTSNIKHSGFALQRQSSFSFFSLWKQSRFIYFTCWNTYLQFACDDVAVVTQDFRSLSVLSEKTSLTPMKFEMNLKDDLISIFLCSFECNEDILCTTFGSEYPSFIARFQVSHKINQ